MQNSEDKSGTGASRPGGEARPNSSPNDVTLDSQFASANAQPSLHRLPPRIGPYRVTRPLGEGGFGAVYVAEQENPRREVALKILKAGTSSRNALARFALEASTLARLSHPGIAQIYDAGFFDERTGEFLRNDFSSGMPAGTPFFAMELIRGVTLTDFVKQKMLSVKGCLALLARIADAVQHAHTRGVVHRDLKPANILVDHAGNPKILDFGVARVIDPAHAAPAMSVHTQAGQLVGTLAYMSPEQIAADAGEIDVRADVYSLGVILFEMLTGKLPFDLQNKVIHEATRIISEAEPARLSTYSRELRGDIETITLKALEKEKGRRYQSAADLAADIRRFLADEPIKARPASKAYQLHKFVQRNRGVVASVIIAFGVLVGGVLATSFQAIRATNAEIAAKKQTAKAMSTVTFMETMLESADPDKKGRDVRVADMLDTTAQDVDAELKDDAELSGAMRRALARAYKGLGLTADASAQADQSVAELTRALGPEDEETLDARMVRAKVWIAQSKFVDAAKEFEAIYQVRERRNPRDSRLGETLASLAHAKSSEGKLDDAEALLRKALAMQQQVLGVDHQDTMATEFQFAQVLAAADKTDEAEKLFNHTMKARIEKYGPNHQRVLAVRDHIGGLYRMQGRFDEAAKNLRETLESFKVKYGPTHPSTIVRMSDLGKTLQQAGKLDEAEKVLREACDVALKTFGPDHFDTLTPQSFLADCLQSKGDLQGALEMRRKVAAGRVKLLGEDHTQTMIAWTNTAYILIDLKQFDEAERILMGLLERRTRLYGVEHNEVGLTRSMLGLCSLTSGDFSKAEKHLRESLKIREKLFPEGNGIRGVTMSTLGDAILRQGRASEAEPLIVKGAEWVLNDPKAPPRNKRDAVDRAVRVFEAQGKSAQAEEWRKKMVK